MQPYFFSAFVFKKTRIVLTEVGLHIGCLYFYTRLCPYSDFNNVLLLYVQLYIVQHLHLNENMYKHVY